jgi:alkanesulfonate monooxygenase SsuD/methylene tetrahydromethanopterin reductase-like flavin-dependent oxidoreductase (luciferase family)
MAQPVDRPMKVGLAMVPYEGAMGGGSPRWSDIRTMAALAEEIGFDSIWLPDHLLRTMDGEPHGVWECCSLLAALAATTERVEIGTFVICAAFRNPALLAKVATTIDEISGGRFILGIGAGWHASEFRAFGYPSDHLYSRFADALQIIDGLLREGRVGFEGEYYAARECELRPAGPRPGAIPLMIGTVGQRMLRLTARYADIWNEMPKANGRNDPEVAAELRGLVDEACLEVGRDPATLERTLTIHVSPLGGVDPMFGQGHTGTPEEIAAILERFACEGISHLQLLVSPNSPAGVEALAPVLAALDRHTQKGSVT